MDHPYELTDTTRRDIEMLVRSVDELEVLLLLGRERARYWSPVAAAVALGRPEPTVNAAMEALAARNLLDIIAGIAAKNRWP